ncbi:MAG: PD40 domain-containing protein [Candidatus Eisenbacteria bacterium]|nr:PD40 domain-containing protein [Candidatus Eisenbacteria bacterium]
MGARCSRSRAALLVAVLAAAIGIGCGKTNSTTGISACDTGGLHLIAFASDRNQAAGQCDIYLYDMDGSGFRLLRNLNGPAVADSTPALSSDGLFIAFVSVRGTSGADIWLYDRSRCAVSPIPGVNTSGDETQPVFTGDGLRLAFVRDTLGRHQIRLINGLNLNYSFVPLPGLDTTATASDWSPAPDRTGGAIAFVSDRDGGPDIFVYDRSGDSLISLPGLNSPADDLEPTLTPDAHWMCFASNRAGGDGGYDLYLYDLTTRTLVALPNLNSAFDERRPSISPNGNVIAFQTARGGTGWDVLYYSRSGSLLANPAPLASAGSDLHPSLRYP